jgi:hypothetical protein
MDDKKEGVITTAQNAIVDTAKEGWEGAKELAETAGDAVSGAVAGLTQKRGRRASPKSKSPSATKRKAREKGLNQRPYGIEKDRD